MGLTEKELKIIRELVINSMREKESVRDNSNIYRISKFRKDKLTSEISELHDINIKISNRLIKEAQNEIRR